MITIYPVGAVSNCTELQNHDFSNSRYNIVEHLNSLPLEEQQNLLLWANLKFYTDVLFENPDQEKTVLDKVWDDFLELFIEAGYTPSDGVE